jgi:serine/threonine protein kinase
MQPAATYKRGDIIDGSYFVHKALQGERTEVYLCLDLDSNLPVALKTLPARDINDARKMDAFYAEVTTRVSLGQHLNIVHCFLLDTSGRRPFMVMEWILGNEGYENSLRGWMRRDTLDLKQSLDFAIQICRGLIHSVDKVPSIVHGALKPGNILVDKIPVAKINDFGQSHETLVTNEVPVNNHAGLPYSNHF